MTLETRTVDRSLRERWNAYVEGHRHAVPGQHFDWSDLVRAHYGCEFIPLACFEGERIAGVLPLYRVRGLKGRVQLISSPYAVNGGILADGPEAAASLLAAAVRISDQDGGARITLKQYKLRIAGDLKVDEGYFNRELSLPPGEEEIWKGLDAVNRERIAETEGTAFALDFPSPDLDAYYRLFSRHQHRNGIPCAGRRWIEDLVTLDMYHPALLRVEGKPLAGALVKSFQRTFSLPYSCVLDGSSRSLAAAYRLYWELIRWHAARGYEVFHSGRIPKAGGVDPFRLGWGGTVHPYLYHYHPNTVSRTESGKRGRKRDLFLAAWKALPLPLANLAGPRIVKLFP